MLVPGGLLTFVVGGAKGPLHLKTKTGLKFESSELRASLYCRGAWSLGYRGFRGFGLIGSFGVSGLGFIGFLRVSGLGFIGFIGFLGGFGV